MAFFFEIDVNGKLIPMGDVGDVSLRVERMRRDATFKRDAKGRMTSDMHELSLTRTDEALRWMVEDTAREHRRGDAFSPGIGMFNPRDLTHVLRNAMEERLPPHNADRLFPINTEVPVGAATYEQSRLMTTGQSVVYRGGMGDDVPEVDLGQASFQQPVIYLVSSFSIDFLEDARASYTGMNTQARKVAAARRVMAERRNDWAFNGAPAYNMMGWFAHPYIDTAVSQVEYNSNSTADDIIDDQNFWLQYALKNSKQAYTPDTVVYAVETYTYLSSTPRNPQSSNDTTILEFLKKANPHIKNWEMANELDDALEPGVHAQLLYYKGNGGAMDRSVELVDVMPPTLLPPEKRALGSKFFMISGFGGTNHVGAGANLLVYLTGR